MKIAVAGLGLIGGSICKALKNNTNHYIIGIDIDKATVKAALEENAVDASGDSKSLGGADLTFICLHPQATLDFARQNKDKFKKGSIVADVCGVKRYIVSRMKNILPCVSTHHSIRFRLLFRSILRRRKTNGTLCSGQKVALRSIIG